MEDVSCNLEGSVTGWGTFVITIRFFPHSWLILVFLTRLTQEVPLEEQEMVNILEYQSSPSVFCGVRFARSLVLCVVFCRSLFVLFLGSLCCLSVGLRLLITRLLSSNLSSNLVTEILIEPPFVNQITAILSHIADKLRKTTKKKPTKLTRPFTSRYIDDVLSLKNWKFGDFVDRIYPLELKVKDTTDTYIAKRQKRWFQFSHCELSNICSNIPNRVCIPRIYL